MSERSFKELYSSAEGLSVGTALQLAQQRIHSDSPRLDAEILLLHALGKTRVYLFSHADQRLTEAQLTAFMDLLDRRVQGEPIAYILECREFWSLPLKVTAATLIPRPETELLVELALTCPLPCQAKIVDLGSGTGAIACALGSERKAWSVLATEKSKAALNILRHNIQSLQLDNVTSLHSDWFSSVPPLTYQLIVSNPPYIAAADPHLDQGDVRFEPRHALVSGSSGLTDIEHIITTGSKFLSEQGWLLLEHGYDQGEKVRQLMSGAGYSRVVTEKDLTGKDRVTIGCWSEGR